MTKEEKILHNQCEIVAQGIAQLSATYTDNLASCPGIIHQLHKAENRSMEYLNGTFIVIVVGPVKSGKSTLVNLIAGAYVSPTHFLECTVRPSIISQKKDGSECSISVYTSEQPANRVEQIDAIIDCIRGIEQESNLSGITKAIYPLTPENIKDKVELDLKSSLISDTLVTSITTPGGILMKEDVFIVDMPGFDGEYANIDDPVYDAIAQRADLIIFVQSSNSAISKVSEQFLRKLSDNNKDVPVCLIHNVFDSAHWRSSEVRQTVIDDQKQFALREIKRLGFNISENQCFSLNLGKVEDARHAAYADLSDLQAEAQHFDDTEAILHERVINHRDFMRLSACASRTQQQLGKLIDAIDQELAQRQLLLSRYALVQQKFEPLRKPTALAEYDCQVTADFSTIKQVIVQMRNIKRDFVLNEHYHRSDSEARASIEKFIAECETQVSASLRSSLSLSKKESELFLLYKEQTGKVREAVAACMAVPLDDDNTRLELADLPSVSLLPSIDLDLLISHKFKLPLFNVLGHTSRDLISYLNAITHHFVGDDDEGTTGYIETEGGPIKPLLAHVREAIADITKKYAKRYTQYLNDNERAILTSIIPDKETFDLTTATLERLKADINDSHLITAS